MIEKVQPLIAEADIDGGGKFIQSQTCSGQRTKQKYKTINSIIENTKISNGEAISQSQHCVLT